MAGHFSISQRIAFLKACTLDRDHIRNHSLKIRKGLVVYLLGIVMVGIMGYQLNYGSAGNILGNRMLEAMRMELEKAPGNADLHTRMGDLYYERRRYTEAAQQYQNAIGVSPDHARALNNLAWLYATCEEVSLRQPRQALELARRAVAADRRAHVLDTLAESYFVNGEVPAALETEKEALGMAKENRAYYREQVKRFETALEAQ